MPQLLTNPIFLMLLFLVTMSAGQVLFKMAGNRIDTTAGFAQLMVSFVSVQLAAALLLYGLSTLLWVYILSSNALSKVYPFVAGTFLIVPLLSIMIFDEKVTPSYFVGVFLILAGIAVVVRGTN